MQLLFGTSEEGMQSGFGWLSGNVVRLQPSIDISVPHMGWQSLNVYQSGGLLSTENVERFYFAHSYVAVPSDPDLRLATVKYGIEFTAAIKSENIMGVQFHPEKSHKYGLHLLQRFSTVPC
jgi:glutamine amidotransferase